MISTHFNIREAKFIDLFAGIGGFRKGIESFGLKCVYSNEWDQHAQRTYYENFGEYPDGDITKVDEKNIPQHNIICGGFPCQAFSISGKRKGFEDTRGTLFFDVARIVRHHKPEVLFLENVKNFARHDDGNTLRVVENTLKDLGYCVFHKVLNASDYGAPTSRERIYIVCFRNDLGISEFSFPLPINKSVKLIDYLDDFEKTKKHIVQRKDIVIRDMEFQPDMFGNYPQRPIQIGTINKGGQGERIYSPLGHAITLSAYGGGAAGKTGGYLVNGVVRRLSPRECARIMGFGDEFKIPVSDSQAYKQFGNSVVVDVVKAIFDRIVKTIERKNQYEQESGCDSTK